MAEENVILGLPTVAKLRSKDLVNESIRRRIIHSFPNGGSPLCALLAWAKIQSINNTKHTWYEKIYISPRANARGTNPATSDAPSTGDADDGTALAAGAKTTGTEIFIKVDSTANLALKDVIRIPAWDVPVIVVDITRGVATDTAKGYIKVKPLRNFTYATSAKINTADVLDVVGSAYAEGSGAGASRGFRYPANLMNQTQIFKEPYEFTGSAAKTDLKFDSTGIYKELSMDACRNHMCKIEKSLIFGQRTTTQDANGREIRTMSGVLEFLKLWDAGATGLTIDGQTYAPFDFKDATTTDTDNQKRFITNADGKVSIDRLERWLRNINLYNQSKTTDRLCLCGSQVMLTMSKMMRDQGSYMWQQGQDFFGTKFNRLITAMGDIVFMTHPLFNENPLYNSSALFLDIWSLNFRPMQDRDSKIVKNIQANDEDLRRDQWITEGTLEFWKPQNHMFVQNFSEYDKTVA